MIPQLTPEQFVIFPWGWKPPHGTTPTDPATLADIRECGFNLAGFISPNDLDTIHAAGMRGILQGESGRHPATFAVYVRDEPGAESFPALAQQVIANQPQLSYINLFPNYAAPGQLQSASYEEYLESYVTTVRPKFISYDHYALFEDGTLRPEYFLNLAVVRATALRHHLPFWNIVLSNAHFNYAEPSPAGLRFQLYTTLAYGARGISYFTYFGPPKGNYRLAPIDSDGRKTPTWAMLRDVNQQLHRLGPTYITLTSVNVFHHPNVPTGGAGLASSHLLSELTGGDLLAGEFTGPQGQPFILVVNKSLSRSTWFGVKFQQPGQIHFLNACTGERERWGGENNWLAPGQGMLLGLDR